MSPYRAAVLGGLLYASPFGVWLLGGLTPAPDGQDLAGAAALLPAVQLLALALWLPALAGAGLAAELAAASLLLAVPWPLLAVFAAGGIDTGPLLRDQVLTFAWGLALVSASHLTVRLCRERTAAGLPGLLQLAAVLALASGVMLPAEPGP